MFQGIIVNEHCKTCDQTGRVEGPCEHNRTSPHKISCKHHRTSSHYYCEHGYTSEHE